MSQPSNRQPYHLTDAHHPPPPPYHHVHSSPSLDAAASHQPSPPSYSHSSPSPLASLLDYLSPPPSSPSAPHSDSLLPFVHLSLGLLSGYSCGYTARHLTRPLLASLALSAALLSLASQQRWVDVRWPRVESDVRQWVELYATRGDAMYRALQQRLQQSEEADGGGEEDGDDDDDGMVAGDGWEEKVVRAVEALAVRLLTTASGVGFTLSLAYALIRRR